MKSYRYTVFLSFRGDDTHIKFMGHLHEALTNKGLHTFKDDRNIRRGETIDLEVLDAIRNSRSSIVVLSKDYASSTWCLEELSQIMECRDKTGQIVLPVFYDIDPSELTDPNGEFEKALRNLESDFAKKFSEDENKYKGEMDKLQRWRKDLEEVSDMTGSVSRNCNCRDDTIFINGIVKDISTQLLCGSSVDATDLVGMNSHVSEMEKLLEIEMNDDIRMVGIWGVGGIGKTTIASVIYGKFSSQFDGGCFLENVGDRFRKDGLPALRKELLSKALKDLCSLQVDIDSEVIKEKLGHKKVLIVVDDVDEIEQLEHLVNADWFGSGSRIIITSQNKQLLVSHGMDQMYKVPFLEHDQSLLLFSRYAFRQKQPTAGYLRLSNYLLSKVDGLPLGLKVLGSYLCGKECQVWESELDRLCKYPNTTIQMILETCCSHLNHMEKQAFLDIACFLNGWKERSVRHFLDACGFCADATLKVLEDKALITTFGNRLFMHKLLQETGREIVQKDSPESVGRSRLWDFTDINSVLSKPEETGNVEVIFLDSSKNDTITIHPEAFKGLKKLRLLGFCNWKKCNVVVEYLSFLPSSLRFLRFPGYPLESLPMTFCPKFLVELILPHSSIRKLWPGKQTLENLISIDLSYSKYLTELPDLSEAHKFQRLNLENCTDLVDVSSIEHLTNVQYLNFRNCEKLEYLPNLMNLELLKKLYLSNCSSLVKICQLPANIEYLYANGTAIEELPLPTDSPLFLIELDVSDCKRLATLPLQLSSTKSLKKFGVDGCPLLLDSLLADTEVCGRRHAEQTGEIGVALCWFENDFDKDRVGRWREALTEVSSLSGWDYNSRDEDVFIEKIVNDIFDQLIVKSSGDSSRFVGMSRHVNKIDELLEIQKDIVRIVGISGIGGIGKTTLARVIYDRLLNQFDGGCFLEDVGCESCKHGLPKLREELLCETLKEKDLSLWPLDLDLNAIKDRVGRKKVLIVIDDVDEIEQLEYLVKPDYFDIGSIIIVTTRNRQLLLAHGVEYIYEVPRLEHDQALLLFCRYAFRQNQPKQGFRGLSNSFVSKVDGIPLALKVLGSFLYEKSREEWVSKLDRLNKFFKTDIQKVLEVGYFGVDDKVRQVYLDIAFLFGGGNERSVRSIIDCCLSNADISLKVLKDIVLAKSSDNKTFMNVLLREIAREIVQRESRDPVKQDRWSFEVVSGWSLEDNCFLVSDSKDSVNVEDSFLDIVKKYKISILPEAFMRPDKLNYQILSESMFSCFIPQRLPKSLFLCSILQYLIELKLEHNNIEELWEGKQDFVNLRLIELKGTKLTKLPDLSRAIKLQKLIFRDCKNLTDVSSIRDLSKLEYLVVEGCKKLHTLPCMIGLESLETLILSGCSSLVKLPELSRSIKYLTITSVAIEELPRSMGSISGLEILDLRNCKRLKRLPSSIAQLKFLKSINISGCTILLRF